MDQKKNIVIGVATHKQYEMPDEGIYKPLFVGAIGKQTPSGYLRDDCGQNISAKNPYFCELTGTYFLWKNIDAEYKGLVHYRRNFSNLNHFSPFAQGTFNKILKRKKLEQLLKNTDIILPQKRHYYIETNFTHYVHAHYAKDLNATREIIRNLYPESLNSFDRVMKKRSAHMFNMYIMKSNLFNEYANWMFSILFELEQRTDISNYSTYEKRMYGFVSELLLDVWIDTNKLTFKEVPVMYMEKQDWNKKISAFLKRKFIGKNETAK